MRRIALAVGLTVLVGLLVLMTQPRRADFTPKGSPGEACSGALAGMPGRGDWRVAVESGEPENMTLALQDGPHVAVCLVAYQAATDDWTASASDAGASAASSPQPLTLDAELSAGGQPPTAIVGRVPDGTAAVRLTLPAGSSASSGVGGGLWLATISPAARPVAVEALDASGAVIARIADPAGLQPGASPPPD